MAENIDKNSPKVVVMPSVEDVLGIPAPSKKESTFDRLWRENGITHEKIALQPKYEDFWPSVGGLDMAIEYLRGSEDEDVAKFLIFYDKVHPDDRDFFGFAGFCVAAGVSGKKIFGAIAAEAGATSEQKMALTTAIEGPKVIAKILQLAQENSPDYKGERKIVAQATGYLPRPKGSQTNIQINAGGIASGGKQMPTIVLPPIDHDLRSLGEKFQQRLNPPKEDIPIIDGEIVE